MISQRYILQYRLNSCAGQMYPGWEDIRLETIALRVFYLSVVGIGGRS